MNKKISGMLGQGNVSNNELDLESYSYCSTETTTKPSMIVWPQTSVQVRRLMHYFNQTHTPITIRGAGTNKVDSTLMENGIIVCSERMNKILSINSEKKFVEVESGVRLDELNLKLSELDLSFPIVPFNNTKTIGGMLASNLKSKESFLLNAFENWVEEVEFVDATGKIYSGKKISAVAEREGITGFITKVKLSLVEKTPLSLDVFNYDKLLDLLNKVRHLKKNKEILFLEFFDKKTSEHLGFGKKYSLIVSYTHLRGKIHNLLDVRSLLEKIDLTHSFLRIEGYYYLQDPFVTLEKSYDLIEWCEKNNVVLTGHIGFGLLLAYFKKEDGELIKPFRSFVRRINGWLGKGFGYGFVNKDFITPPKRKEFVRLKDDYDYNNIISPGKIISYR